MAKRKRHAQSLNELQTKGFGKADIMALALLLSLLCIMPDARIQERRKLLYYRFSQISIRNLSWAGLIHISRKEILS